MKVSECLWAVLIVCLFITGCVADDSSLPSDEFCTVAVRLSDGGSRASDDPAQGGVKSEYDGLTVCFTDGNRILFCDTVYDSEEIKAFQTSGKVYENVTASVSQVFILANVKQPDALSVEPGISVAAVDKAALGLLYQQPDAAHPENTAAGGLKVTMSGVGNVVEQDGTNAGGLKRMKAEITLAPVVSRLEIYGAPQPAKGIHSLKVDKLYLNGYYARREFVPENYVMEEQNIHTYAGNISGDANVFNNIVNIGPDGKPLRTDAHHLFTDGITVGLPHLVLEVSGVYADGAGVGGAFSKRYITVNSYANVRVMKCGNIYKVNLSLLSVTPEMLDPVPEAGRMTLQVSVGIEGWNERLSFPEV